MKRKLSVRENGTRRVQFVPEGDSLVEQSHKDTCDINYMMARARRGSFIPPSNKGQYGDFTNVTDFHSAQNQILAAEATFFALPAELRERFNNDPHEVLAFINDEANEEEAIRLGLLDRPPGVPEEGVTASAAADPPPEGESPEA